MKNVILFGLFILLGCSAQSSKQYKIVYNVGYDMEADDYEVFIMDMDGSNKKNLSNWKGVDWAYSAWKDKIYFLSDRDTTHRMYFLYEMDFNGQNIRKISDYRMRDSWMSRCNDGSQLIVNPHSSIDSIFYLVDINGKKLGMLKTGLPYNNDPAFSADGKQIVFRGGEKKSKKEKGFVDELYLINTDGSGLKQLTHYPPNDTTAEWYAYKAGPPRWNFNENFITYQSKQAGKYSLYAVSPENGKQWKLTDNPHSEGWHDWSSDGKWLAIEIFDEEQNHFDIALMNWDTKEMKVLTDTSYVYQQGPTFVEVLK